MAELASRERLQPALLDRLTDDDPQNRQPEPREARVVNKSRFRQAVLRDLAWLFNATSLATEEDLDSYDYVRKSVLNFGLPALSGHTASSLDVLELEESVRQAVLAYEPRILPSTLVVSAVLSANELHQHNVVSLELRGRLWAHPIPVELLLRTDLDLETGEVQIRDLDSSGGR
jgi:type VI secretion system protein ImpF